MLPSSHFLLIDSPSSGLGGWEGDSHPAEGSPAAAHAGVISGLPLNPSERALALTTAFSEFAAASSRLENSYRELQEEVSQLKLELSRRRAALEKSQAENEQMRLAVQQTLDRMPCGVLVLKEDGRIPMVNPEARRLLGVEVEPRHKESLLELSAPTGIDLESCAVTAGRDEIVREFAFRQADAVRSLEIRSQRIVSDTGDGDSQTILILRDTTAQKRAEEDREAGRSAMARAELAGVLAHEIRNPLASLELFSELIEKDDRGRGKWVSHLRAGLRSLSATVNNVLSFHSGEFSLQLIELCSAIDDALDFAKPIIAQAGILLEQSQNCKPVWIEGNRSALQQLILNLASNAVRHTPPGGRITVSMRGGKPAKPEIAGDVVLEFADSGCGIPAGEVERVFEPGFSGTGDTSGLGLTVCAQIMKRHGGQISASNQCDGGARFKLLFPTVGVESESSWTAR